MYVVRCQKLYMGSPLCSQTTLSINYKMQIYLPHNSVFFFLNICLNNNQCLEKNFFFFCLCQRMGFSDAAMQKKKIMESIPQRRRTVNTRPPINKNVHELKSISKLLLYNVVRLHTIISLPI